MRKLGSPSTRAHLRTSINVNQKIRDPAERVDQARSNRRRTGRHPAADCKCLGEYCTLTSCPLCERHATIGGTRHAKTSATLDICETERGRPYAGSEIVYDGDGKAIGSRSVSRGWDGIAEIAVRWQVRGGTAPYTLVIDSENRDGDGPYEGTSGTASVSCAVTSAEVFYTSYTERRFRSDPQIDSGPKTIHATVTDATGVTADASVNIYTIIQLRGDGTMISGKWRGYRLNSGNTYRYNGTLFTMPQGITILPVESWQGEGGYGRVLTIEGTCVWIVISRRNEELYRIFGAMTFSAHNVYPDQGYDAVRGSSIDTPPHRAASAYLDDFMASRGQLPAVSGSN